MAIDKDVEYTEDVPLEELIKACGEWFEALIARGNGDDDNWEVRGKDTRYNASTPEEATAKLWLALNTK